jgi:hypothetical protein
MAISSFVGAYLLPLADADRFSGKCQRHSLIFSVFVDRIK